MRMSLTTTELAEMPRPTPNRVSPSEGRVAVVASVWAEEASALVMAVVASVWAEEASALVVAGGVWGVVSGGLAAARGVWGLAAAAKEV